VAPSGTPAGATGAPGPMPSGVVTKSDDGAPMGEGVTCARAGCVVTSAVAAISMERCFIDDSVSATCSAQATAVAGRSLSSDLTESCRERAGLAETERQSDLGYRVLPSSQQDFRLLNAPLNVIPMRRHAKRLLEGPAKLIST
jgi:hypothetical protein